MSYVYRPVVYPYQRRRWIVPIALSMVNLYATLDGTVSNVVNELDASSPLWSSINDDPSTPTDSDWVNNAVEV